MSKKRVVKDFDKLPEDIQLRIRKEFPAGFAHKLVTYSGPKGERISALPFETDDTYYLVRWSIQEYKPLPAKDDDLDEVFTSREEMTYDDSDVPAVADDDSDDYSSDDYGMAGGSGSDSESDEESDY